MNKSQDGDDRHFKKRSAQQRCRAEWAEQTTQFRSA